MTSGWTSRRAVALLVVLAALVLTAAGAVAMAGRVSALVLARRDARDLAIAEDLSFAAESAIVQWLRTAADSVVLPPDALNPCVPISDVSFTLERRDYRVRLAAWDQYGMAPLSLLQQGSPVREALADETLTAIRTIEHHERIGLDEITASAEAAAFPDVDEPAIGSFVATHNPGATSRGGTPKPLLNINTAPARLLETSLRLAGHANVEHILRAREEGRPASIGAAPGARWDDEGLAPDPVTRSDCWAVRIDVSVGAVNQSWWTVWSRSRAGWRIVQRILIREGPAPRFETS
jgi:hypothetical protein